MKCKSSKKKKATSDKVAPWLQIIAIMLTGIGTFLLGIAEILKIILKLNQVVNFSLSSSKFFLATLDYHFFFERCQMNFVTILKIIQACGLLFIGTGLVIFAIIKIKELFNERR